MYILPMRNGRLIMNSETVERCEKAMVNHMGIYMKLLAKTFSQDSGYPLFKATNKLSLLNKYKYESDQKDSRFGYFLFYLYLRTFFWLL
jgi:hypothetical protein